MKILPILLVNLVMVGGGLVVYDQLKSDAPASAPEVSGGIDAVDLAQLEERLLARQHAGQPVLRATGTDERVLARLAAVEKKLAAVRGDEPAADDPGAPAGTPEIPVATPDAAADGPEPSEGDVARFRRLMERAEAQRQEERERERIVGFLARIEVDLSADQQEKLLASTRNYRRKWGETMRQAFQGGAGGDREAARETIRAAGETLRQEFSVEIQEYMTVGDAQKITENVTGLVRGGFGGMRRGGPPGGGGGGR